MISPPEIFGFCTTFRLVEQAHERNPDVPPDVIDVLVEEAREATQGRQ